MTHPWEAVSVIHATQASSSHAGASDSAPELNRMATHDVAVRLIFLLQTVVGSVGNFSLLYLLALPFKRHKLQSTYLILRHLIVANLLHVFCGFVPNTMVAFGLKGSFSDTECKLLFYAYRVGRGVSIGSTCLLSILQAITISPWLSTRSQLKAKALRHAGSFIYLNWLLSLLVNVLFPLHQSAKSKDTNTTNLKDFGYCSAVRHNKATDSLYTSQLICPDVVCLGLMLWASSYMVFVLHRHKQQVRHVRSTNISPETRATTSTLLLASTFVYFYVLSCIFQALLGLLHDPGIVLVNWANIVSGCFPTISPFLLMRSNPNMSRLCWAWMRNRKPTVVCGTRES